MKKSGLAFHSHHDVLVGYVYDYDGRVNAIKESKPPSEQGLRLRLFKLIPEDRLPAALNKAVAEYDNAVAKYEKAAAEYDKALAKHEKVRAEEEMAWAERKKALVEYRKALAKCEPFLIELHKELCPDCPWDGKTIFSE